MLECVWIRIRDDTDPMEVLQKAHDAMGTDGHIIAVKPVDDIEKQEGHEEIIYREGEGLTWSESTILK